MKKRLYTVALLILLLFAGCGENNPLPPTEEAPKTVAATPVEIDMEAQGHIEQMHDYDSPYTICYRNSDDTYSMYVFAAPVQYKAEGGYQVIDNSLIPSEREGFSFENKANEVKTYFPKTLDGTFRIEKGTDYMEFVPQCSAEGFSAGEKTDFTNMYGDTVEAVIYKRNDMDMAFYPTKAGIKLEIVLKERPDSNDFFFRVETNAVGFENKKNGYITFLKGDQIKNIIYQPLVQYTKAGEAQMSTDAYMNVERKEGDTIVQMIVGGGIFHEKGDTEYPVRLDPSFEMYLNKMPDSTVYEKKNVNQYLANYAVVGDHPYLGQGQHYMRLRLNYFMTVNGEDIQDANFFVRPLWSCGVPEDLRAYEAESQWSSTQMLWDCKVSEGEPLQTYVQENGYWKLPMRDYIKECFADPTWQKESVGFLVRGEEVGKYGIIATSDHSLYAPYLRIDLNQLPTYFEAKDNINQIQF